MAKSSEFAVVFGEGESKVCKTTALGGIARALAERGLQVVQADAGSFFRKVTVATLYELYGAGVDNPTQADYNAASSEVLEAGIPQDITREWTGLHTSVIDRRVAIVSDAAHVQEAGEEWWNDTLDQAVKADADVLLFDGRNPRNRCQEWMAAHGVVPSLELFCVCPPEIAAERTLMGRYEPVTEISVQAETAAIVARRERDRGRAPHLHPYRDPDIAVPYLPGDDVRCTIELASKLDNGIGPAPIRFETGSMDRETMNNAAKDLAFAVLGLLE